MKNEFHVYRKEEVSPDLFKTIEDSCEWHYGHENKSHYLVKECNEIVGCANLLNLFVHEKARIFYWDTIEIKEDFFIPPLIIQPLIENSIKYNIKREKVLDIGINIFKNGKKSTIKILDSGKRVNQSMLNKGTGLTLTKKRVENSNGTFLIENGEITISFKI